MPDREPEGAEYYGVVSLLDEEHEERVLRLREELEGEFGLSFRDTYLPHFTYHSARRYDLNRVQAVLRRRAAESVPIEARCSVLAVIRAPEMPCFLLPLVRAAVLSELHRVLWEELSEIAFGILDRYGPEYWMATVNLTPDIERDLSKALLEYLLQRDWAWEMRIDNLSLLHDTGTRQELALRFDFGGGRTAPRSSP